MPPNRKSPGVKMRKLNSETVVTVYGWFITRHGWEYYLLDDKRNCDVRFALVHGYEQEMGDVSMEEVYPFRRTACYVPSEIRELNPAPGWVWV